MTLLNLTVVHYGLAFLNDWLLSFNVFFSPSDFLSSPLRHSSLDTQGQRKKNILFLRGDCQWTLRFLLLLALGHFHQKLYFTNCGWKKVLWTQWGTFTWIMPTTDALALFICQCCENTLFFPFSQLFLPLTQVQWLIRIQISKGYASAWIV